VDGWADGRTNGRTDLNKHSFHRDTKAPNYNCIINSKHMGKWTNVPCNGCWLGLFYLLDCEIIA
jgi:hypothetical protein